MSELRLAEWFPPVSPDAWEAAIRADLKGADYAKRLVWQTGEGGIAVRPYYTRRDLEPLAAWLESAAIPGQAPWLRGSGQPWRVAGHGEQPLPHAQVDASLWHQQGATVVEELGFAIAAAWESFLSAPQPMVVRFGIGPNFFFEIAKLRAARILWSRLMELSEADRAGCAQLRIHAVTGLTNKSLADRYNNLLRATTEALSAVLGACDWLTVRPFHFEERLAINVQRILREECLLDRVADPGGGSYYLEWLTDAVARAAWGQLQEIERAGGFAAWSESGALDTALSTSRTAKEQAMATRRAVLVGVNQYADPAETLPEEHPEELGVWRLAGMFEALRRRTERHSTRTGHAPEVLLLEAGDAKMRKARSGFSAGFFACAGFRSRIAMELDDRADLIVLCSSDAEYLELARRICPVASRPVLVAGNPKESVDELRAAGVAGFIYLGANAVETLSHWQDQLGMEKD